jgi:HAD superfamily hydrolase (TIGR01450 family)
VNSFTRHLLRLGFNRFCTLEEVSEAYPLLDIVDHDNRKKIATQGYHEKDFARIEAIVLLGEPKRWESALQLLVDLLKTDGKPNKAPAAIPDKHLPVIACNTDLQFMDRACMPRYGHGAFLVCLEALYKKVTGRELKYTALVGKPSEITFRYAEHCLSNQAKQLGVTEPLQRMYLIGDTLEVDVVGTNLYQRYIDRLHRRINNEIDLSEDSIDNPMSKHGLTYDSELPQSRNVPRNAALQPQTVTDALPILVCTGVYRPNNTESTLGEDNEKHYQGHRDFPNNPALYKPSKIVKDVHEAVEYIVDFEHFSLAATE